MAEKLEGIRACVFDAYGTLFDFNSATGRCREALGDKADALSELWRAKQLQYTWLRALMGRHAPFHQVTADALDYALAALDISGDGLRAKLLDLYMNIDAFAEVPDMLAALQSAGLKTAILSNGSREMLDAAIDHTGIGGLLDAVISVDEVGVFKPHFSVYQLAVDRMGVDAAEISFQSSNAWDAVAAATFGMRVVWVNRYGQPPERLTATPDIEVETLAALPAILGLAPAS